MRAILGLLAGIALLMLVNRAGAVEYEIASQSGLVYAEHDGAKLIGDLYQPKGRTKAPALVAIHGGGWQRGDRGYYKWISSSPARTARSASSSCACAYPK
jgi:acetyl esterase/lipase